MSDAPLNKQFPLNVRIEPGVPEDCVFILDGSSFKWQTIRFCPPRPTFSYCIHGIRADGSSQLLEEGDL